MAIKNSGLYSADAKNTIPLTSIEIHAEIIDICSKVSLKQKFRNNEDHPIEAVYCFPHEAAGTVSGMTINTGTEEITALAEEREKAFERYDMALEKGKKAFLLDQEDGDILLISAGNIMPKSEVNVEIKYIRLLNVSDSIMRLQIPSALTPRHAVENSDPVKIDRATPPYADKVPYQLKISVSVKSKEINALYSPSHEINKIRNADGTWEITLKNEVSRPDRDFILELHSDSLRKPLCLAGKHENGEEAAMIRLYPEPYEEKVQEGTAPSDIIFMLDCSESMAGAALIQGKEIIANSLQSMKADDVFNIICFGRNQKKFYEKSLECNEKNIARVLKDLSRVEADMGGTELNKIISHACSLPVRPGGMRSIILITDGAVHNASELIRDAVSENRGVRFFTFGTGYGASHQLIKRLAEASRGAWEMIQPGENTAPKVLRQFSRINQTPPNGIEILTQNIELVFNGELPPFYDGDAFTLFAKIKSIGDNASVIFKGKNEGGSFIWKCRIENIGSENAIPLLWAADRIIKLETAQEYNHETEKEIKDIALDFNLLSSQTSLVGISRKKGASDSAMPEYRRVPLCITKGYEEYSDYTESSYTVQDQPGVYAGKLKYYNEKVRASWYQEIIAEQNPSGYFDNIELIAPRLGIEARLIADTIKTSGVYPESETYKAVVTVLTIKVLASNEYAIPAINRAQSWLSKITDKTKFEAVVHKITSLCNENSQAGK